MSTETATPPLKPIYEGHVQALGSCSVQQQCGLRAKLRKPVKFHLGFLSILLMVFIVSVDATALAVAIPSITTKLNGTTLEAFWINTSFLLVVTVVLPLYTSISETLGRKLPLYTAFFLFGIGSVVFASAQSMSTMIIGRALQGSGCGGLDVLNEIIVADITTLQERAFYIGLLSVPFASGSILGPIFGAILTEKLSWRWIGWMNLPLIGCCLPLAMFCLDLMERPGSIMTRLSKVDWLGLLLFTVGSFATTLPLSWAGVVYSVRSWQTLVPLVSGIALLIVFAWYETRSAQPLFPHRVCRNRSAVIVLTQSIAHGVVFYTLIFHLPLFFQSVYFQTPIQSSISIIPLFAVLMLFTGISAVGIEWTRRYVWQARLSWALLALGCGLCIFCGNLGHTGPVVGCLTVAAVGLGSLFTLLPIAIQASVENAQDQGLAVGILVSFRLFGASIGLALSASAFSSQFRKALSHLGGRLLEVDFIEDESQALGFIPYLRGLRLSTLVLRDIQHLYWTSFRTIFYILTAFGVCALLVSFLMKEKSLESEKVGEQPFDA